MGRGPTDQRTAANDRSFAGSDARHGSHRPSRRNGRRIAWSDSHGKRCHRTTTALTRQPQRIECRNESSDCPPCSFDRSPPSAGAGTEQDARVFAGAACRCSGRRQRIFPTRQDDGSFPDTTPALTAALAARPGRQPVDPETDGPRSCHRSAPRTHKTDKPNGSSAQAGIAGAVTNEGEVRDRGDAIPVEHAAHVRHKSQPQLR